MAAPGWRPFVVNSVERSLSAANLVEQTVRPELRLLPEQQPDHFLAVCQLRRPLALTGWHRPAQLQLRLVSPVYNDRLLLVWL